MIYIIVVTIITIVSLVYGVLTYKCIYAALGLASLRMHRMLDPRFKIALYASSISLGLCSQCCIVFCEVGEERSEPVALMDKLLCDKGKKPLFPYFKIAGVPLDHGFEAEKAAINARGFLLASLEVPWNDKIVHDRMRLSGHELRTLYPDLANSRQMVNVTLASSLHTSHVGSFLTFMRGDINTNTDMTKIYIWQNSFGCGWLKTYCVPTRHIVLSFANVNIREDVGLKLGLGLSTAIFNRSGEELCLPTAKDYLVNDNQNQNLVPEERQHLFNQKVLDLLINTEPSLKNVNQKLKYHEALVSELLKKVRSEASCSLGGGGKVG